MASAASDLEARALILRESGEALHVALNRPEKRNALSLDLMDELTGVLETVGGRSDVRVVVIEGRT